MRIDRNKASSLIEQFKARKNAAAPSVQPSNSGAIARAILEHHPGESLIDDATQELRVKWQASKLPLAELARISRVPYSHLHTIMSGIHRPNIKTVASIAAALGYETHITFKKGKHA